MKTEFYNLLLPLVKEGLEKLKIKVIEKPYISTHFNWVTLKYKENGFPDFTESSFVSGPTDFSSAFSFTHPNTSPIIAVENLEFFQPFFKYCCNDKDILNFFLPPKPEASPDSDIIFKFSCIQIFAGIIDRYIHTYNSYDFNENNFKELYLPCENLIFSKQLFVDICIPILFLKFDFDEYEIDESSSIMKMDDKFQAARYPMKAYGTGVHNSVLASATHILVLKNYSIDKPENYWNVLNITGRVDAYPIDIINKFFGALRIVKGFYTGYSQLLLKPNGWGYHHKADLPYVAGTSIKAYPNWFEDFYWNIDNHPLIKKSDIKRIGDVFLNLRKIKENSINIGLKRLNQCYLRDDDEDLILDVTISLEALLIESGNQEMTHKLALRVGALSHLFEDFSKSPTSVFKDIKQIYACRSEIIHGKESKTIKKEISISDKKKVNISSAAIEYLRYVLKVLIYNSEYRQGNKIDELILLNRLTT